MRRFAYLCIPLLVLVTACASVPTQQAQPSILDVLEQSSQQSPTEAQYAGSSSRKCPGGMIDVCVVEARGGVQKNCACMDSSEATLLLGGAR